jgi:hypothetical protein
MLFGSLFHLVLEKFESGSSYIVKNPKYKLGDSSPSACDFCNSRQKLNYSFQPTAASVKDLGPCLGFGN